MSSKPETPAYDQTGDDEEDRQEFLEYMAEKYEGEFKGRVAELVLQASSEEVSS